MPIKIISPESVVDTERLGLLYLETSEGSVTVTGPVRAMPSPGKERSIPEDAVTFRLEKNDAREYSFYINGMAKRIVIRRTPGPGRFAVREISLPPDRPVVLLVENLDQIEPEGLASLARMVDGLGRPPLLCPGSALAVFESGE
ncbi:MAG: hypothetical protein V3573_00450 [Desulfovibrionaceae bacterium]